MKEDKIKVSVVVPVYNVEMYLKECVEGLIMQTLDNIEIILVDDGSTDESGKICDDYAVRYDYVSVIHKINNGLGSARNVGLATARGKYVYFIDSDDYLEINALKMLYQEAEEKKLDVILFSAESFSDGTGMNFNVNEYKRTGFLNTVMNGKDLFLKLRSISEYYASIPLRFYNTEYLKAKDYYFPEDIIHEDEIYGYWSLIEANKAECIADRYYKRRVRAGSIMTSKQAYRSSVGYIYTWKKIVGTNSFFEWKKEEENEAYIFANGLLSIVASLYCSAFNVEERRNFYKEIKEMQCVDNFENAYKCMSIGLRMFVKVPSLFRILSKMLERM